MRLAVLVISLLLANTALAKNTVTDFAKHLKYRDAIISPNGDYIALSMRTDKGKSAIAVLRLSDMEWMSNVQLRDSTTPYSIRWANQERLVVRLAQAAFGQNEPLITGELFAMNFDGSKSINLILFPSFKNYMKYKPVNQLIGFATPVHDLPDDPENIVIHFDHWGNSLQDKKSSLFKLNIYNGKIRKIA